MHIGYRASVVHRLSQCVTRLDAGRALAGATVTAMETPWLQQSVGPSGVP